VEPALEEMPATPVATVEDLRVAAVEALHPGGKPLRRGRDDDVVVRVHQAVRVDIPAELLGDRLQQIEEVEPIDVLAEDRRRTDAVRRDVEDTVREVASAQPWHPDDGSCDRRRRSGLRTNRHEIATHWCQTRVGPGAVPGPRGGVTRVWPGSGPELTHLGGSPTEAASCWARLDP